MLNLVQPAVTRQIKTLEDELGVALFVRTRHGMALTSAGEIFLDHARSALHEMKRARSEIAPLTGDVSGLVSVGMPESLLDLVVPALERSVAERHPGVELRVMSGFSGYLQAWLDKRVIDIAVLYNLSDSPAMQVKPLLVDRLWAVAPAGERLLPTEEVRWERVLSGPLILPIPGHGLRALIDKALSEVPIEAEIALETNSMSVQKQMVLAGRGWTILPGASVARDIQEGRLSGSPLDEPSLSQSVVIGLPRRARIPRAVTAVNSELLRVACELVASGRWPSAALLVPPKA
jgi:DNA-binding transcriptional LysR family regulator